MCPKFNYGRRHFANSQVTWLHTSRLNWQGSQTSVVLVKEKENHHLFKQIAKGRLKPSWFLVKIQNSGLGSKIVSSFEGNFERLGYLTWLLFRILKHSDILSMVERKNSLVYGAYFPFTCVSLRYFNWLFLP